MRLPCLRLPLCRWWPNAATSVQSSLCERIHDGLASLLTGLRLVPHCRWWTSATTRRRITPLPASCVPGTSPASAARWDTSHPPGACLLLHGGAGAMQQAARHTTWLSCQPVCCLAPSSWRASCRAHTLLPAPPPPWQILGLTASPAAKASLASTYEALARLAANLGARYLVLDESDPEVQVRGITDQMQQQCMLLSTYLVHAEYLGGGRKRGPVSDRWLCGSHHAGTQACICDSASCAARHACALWRRS